MSSAIEAATIHAAPRAPDVELGGRNGDRAHLEHALDVIEVQFHRSVLHDLTPTRRAGNRERLGEALGPLTAGAATEPLRTVAEHESAVATNRTRGVKRRSCGC